MCVIQKHGCVMTLVNQNSSSLDTFVLDATETDMVMGMDCLYLMSWNTRFKGTEFILVSFFSMNNVNEKVPATF